jgi:hypothetical protein
MSTLRVTTGNTSIIGVAGRVGEATVAVIAGF